MAEGKTSTLKWLGCGCAVLLVLAIAGAGTCGAVIYTATKAPAEAAHAFLADLRAQNLNGALARTSPEYQAAHPPPTFAATIASAPALIQHTDATLSSRNVQNFNAEMSGTLLTAAGEVPVAISLVSAPQGWVVTAITVNGMRLP